MSSRPVHLRLTDEQVASVVAAQAGQAAAGLAAELSEQVLRQTMPPISAWEECERVASDVDCSLALLRGLRLLAELAGGRAATIDDLTSDLKLSPSAVNAYIQTLLLTGIVEKDAETQLYRLAGTM